MIQLLRTLKWRRLSRSDVLIVDSIGAQWLERCIPNEFQTHVLDIREHILLIDIGFFLRLIWYCIYRPLTHSGRLGGAWLSALINSISPRLVVSFADNNKVLAHYASANAKVPVIFIQNALRGTAGSITPEQDLPHYLAFGEVEKELFTALSVKCEKYQPVGSLKLGFALVEHRSNRSNIFDMAFISHYRPEMESPSSTPIEKQVKNCQSRLFSLLCGYSAQRQFSTVVILKTRDKHSQQKEKDYFIRHAGGHELRFVTADKSHRELDSYHAGLSSTVIVHPGSTLGFELFAAGKKVLFGAGIDANLISTWGVELYFQRLPEVVRLPLECNQREFDRYCDELRAMSDEEYSSETADIARSIIAMPTNEQPHTRVKEIISGLLDPSI